MARLYVGENFSHRVLERLRAQGHDVLTVQEAGERGVGRTRPDSKVMRIWTTSSPVCNQTPNSCAAPPP
jgi:hypothetical protein